MNISHDPDEHTRKLNVQLLASMSLFRGLPNDVLENLVRELLVVVVEPGQVVCREGEDSHEMYVVLDGELEVLKLGPRGSDVRVAVFGPDDWFGEMAVLEVRPRSATVRATAPSRLLRVSSSDVEEHLIERNPAAYTRLLLNVARELSRRLRVADGILAQFAATISDTYHPKSVG